MRMVSPKLATGLMTAALLSIAGAATAAPFTVSSSTFSDGGMLTKKQAADDPMRMCGGENVSPALAWANAPDKTKSFVVFMLDPDGLLGQGVSHWVGYNIPSSVKGLAEGEITKGSKNFTGGKARATTRSTSDPSRRPARRSIITSSRW